MTFLLFLASLAVLEYLVRDVGRKSPEVRKAVESVPLAHETSTSDLLALGQALGGMRETADCEKLKREMVSPVEEPPGPH